MKYDRFRNEIYTTEDWWVEFLNEFEIKTTVYVGENSDDILNPRLIGFESPKFVLLYSGTMLISKHDLAHKDLQRKAIRAAMERNDSYELFRGNHIAAGKFNLFGYEDSKSIFQPKITSWYSESLRIETNPALHDQISKWLTAEFEPKCSG